MEGRKNYINIKDINLMLKEIYPALGVNISAPCLQFQLSL